MATTLELMYNLRREIIVIGDLNFDLCSDHNDIKKFKELCDQFQLTNSVEKPTRLLRSLQLRYLILFFAVILAIM